MEKRSPFDYVKTLSETKNYIMNEIEDEKTYVPFLVNRHFSFIPDTIFFAQEMNINNIIDKKLQYDYYFHSLPKKKRYAKWAKRKDVKNLDVVMEYYQVNNSKAKQILSLLNEEQIAMIKNKLEKGGIV